MAKTSENKFRFYRVQAGLTQREVADELGLGSYVICDYERGRAEPSIKVLKQLGALYRVSLDDLLDNPPIDGKPEDPALDDLIRLVNSYEGKARENAIDLAKEVLRKTKK